MSVAQAVSVVDATTSRLRVRVQPGAKRAGVALDPARGLTVRVAAAAVEGAANAAVIELLARALLRLPRSALRLHSGARGRDKVIEVDLDADALIARLDAALASSG